MAVILSHVFVINCPPQLVPFAIDLHEILVQGHCYFEYDCICCARFRRVSAASIGPRLFHKYQIVSWLMSMPRSYSVSSTFRSVPKS